MSSTTARSRPTADPYADTDVIDARAPRFLQATVGVGAVTALVTAHSANAQSQIISLSRGGPS